MSMNFESLMVANLAILAPVLGSSLSMLWVCLETGYDIVKTKSIINEKQVR